jgi:uncharacterized protein YqfA (UPF0365 family)
LCRLLRVGATSKENIMHSLVNSAWCCARTDPQGTPMTVWIGGVVVLLILFVLLWAIATWARLWLQALSSGTPVTLIQLIGMWLRRVNAGVILECRIKGAQAGIDIPLAQLESAFLARGGAEDVRRLVDATITAQHAGLPVTFQELARHLLAGGDLDNVIHGLTVAQRNGMPMEFATACEIDLAGNDVTDKVRQGAAQLQESLADAEQHAQP